MAPAAVPAGMFPSGTWQSVVLESQSHAARALHGLGFALAGAIRAPLAGVSRALLKVLDQRAVLFTRKLRGC